MEEIKMSPKNLKEAIDNGKLIGSGFLGAIFEYKDKLIKLDKTLYDLLKINDSSFARDVIDDKYKYMKNDFNDRNQLEYLFSKQKDVKLTKLPTGIITLTDVDTRNIGISPGILIPYHRNHDKLETLSRDEYKKVLIILRKLLEAVRELADNKIAQEDFVQYNRFDNNARGYNVMYKDTTPEIIDLSGEMIKAGTDFVDAKEMYRSLGNLVFDYFYFNKLESPYKENKVENDKQVSIMLDEFENQTKGK